MYYQYFGLNEAPFSIAVNPRYLFMSARHREALAHLLYGVGEGGGFILLTGEVGTGKTTINRSLLDQLPENIDLALVLNPAVNATELLATVCDELGIDYEPGETSLKRLTDKIHHFLLANHARHRNTVLLIDEAQHLKFDVLEQIRLLTNLETNTEKLLQIILVGQPELQQLLAKPELRQLSQRITARYQLKPLDQEETESYIRHRLQVAGFPAGQELFSSKITKGIYRASNGVPRIINVLCDRMLLGAYGKNRNKIDDELLKQAVTEVFGEETEVSSSPWSYGFAAVAGCLVVVMLGLGWWQWTQDRAPVVTEAAIAVEKRFTPAPEPLPVQQAVRWYSDPGSAVAELFKRLALAYPPGTNPCLETRADSYHCEGQTAETWQELIAFNRPAVLELVTHSRLYAYAVLVAIDGQEAWLSHHGRLNRISLQQLGELWTGEFTFVWRPASDYQQPFALGDRGPMVLWLASRFAEIDGQEKLLSGEKFNPALAARVKIFQRENALADDGVVGLKTLLKVNEALGLEKTLDNTVILDHTLTGGAG